MSEYLHYRVIRRNGQAADFDANKIRVAMTKAFLAVEGGNAASSNRVHGVVDDLTREVCRAVTRHLDAEGAVHIESIQDQVELVLMRNGEYKVARAYVLYREERARVRSQDDSSQAGSDHAIRVTRADGSVIGFDEDRFKAVVAESVADFASVSGEKIIHDATKGLFDGMKEEDIGSGLVLAARSLIEQDPDYSCVAARLLLDGLRTEVLTYMAGEPTYALQSDMSVAYGDYFKQYVKAGIDLGLLDEQMGAYDLEKLAAAMKPERDWSFTYLGLQTLYDRYFLHTEHGTRIELPQAFFMRVSMGLAVNEVNREERAVEFYHLLSSFDFMSSTPTLFNSGTVRPQLSSCYLTTVPDDLGGIFNSIRDDAMLSKFAGGLGNDWSRVRALGAYIKGTNGRSQGVVPFLKVANDMAVAVNQGGKRKGAVCAYLETWHLDIEEFLELRKNTGDERRRTHDMNTANWIPDLFMKRVSEEGVWTLFSPDETADLHELTGRAFEARYREYEAMAERGDLRMHKTLPAVELWRKMLGLLFETGHPWITFKDACNLRSPQQHVGVVHSSNLCTEITLNTSDEEIAVCNLGSINLARHLNDRGLDTEKLKATVVTAVRMLDNVIDINYYGVSQARSANLQHRPIGLGLMGFQDALYRLKFSYASEEAVEFADRSMETISYYAIQASSHLAAERGRYPSFEGSFWSKGVLPIDSLDCLEDVRDGHFQVDRSATLDWKVLREQVREQGMRNSNCMAIAPTATISNICGIGQSIEPTYHNLFVKSNLSGEFTVVNPYLVAELKALDLWDEVMVGDLKHFDGSVQQIERIPDEVRSRYRTAFEIEPHWLVEAAARRQKWIDQGQSLNLYMAEPSGRKLDSLYRLAWQRGLKTTYYLRSLGATHMEKAGRASMTDKAAEGRRTDPVCDVSDLECEVCQ